jgi:molybdate transport system permease protein
MNRFLKDSNPGKWLVIIAALIALLFLTLPLLALIVRAVQNRAWETLTAGVVSNAILLSAWTTFWTVIFALVFGTPLAYIFARYRFPFKRELVVLVELPVVLPPAVAGLALLLTFGRRGLFGPTLESLGITLAFTTFAIILAQTFVAAPFYIRAAQVGFQSVPDEIEDAARVDGAGGMALFFRITLPLAGRSLAAGLVLCWARAAGEFGATILFAGSLQTRQTMPLLIYKNFETDINAAVATGVIMVVLALLALLLSRWLANDEGQR